MRFASWLGIIFIFNFFHLPAACYYPYECDCLGENDCLCHVFYGLQGLYWTICEPDLDFTIDQELHRQDISKIYSFKPNWNVGLRGLFGWNWYCGWEIDIVYTYYCNHFQRDILQKDDSFPLSAHLFATENGIKLAKKALYKRSYEYQTLDAIIGKSLFFCETMVVLNPYFGVRGLKLNKRSKTVYEGNDFKFPGKFRNHKEFDAAGLHAGIHMQLILKCGFSLCGGVAGSILASKCDQVIRQKLLDQPRQQDSLLNQSQEKIKITVKNSQWVSLPGLHLFAGLVWNRSLERCLFFNIKIGYEFHDWQNIAGLTSFDRKGCLREEACKNFALHGVTLAVGIYF